MISNKNKRGYEQFIGILFILATLTYGLGNQLIADGIKNNSHTISLNIGMLLELVNSLAVGTIGGLSFLLLSKFNKSVVKGYTISRILEGILLAIGTLSVLWMTDSNMMFIQKFRDTCFSVAMISLGAYSICFYGYLLQTDLAPKWLMVLGIFGYFTLSIYAVLFLILGKASMFLFIPGGLFELIFPIYLIKKGYRILQE